jgi:AraC-like DNA-binding protein
MALEPERVSNSPGTRAISADPVQSYRERLPAPELAREVASVWVLEVGAEGGAYEHRTVPNGSVEISYALGSDRVDVSGPQRRPLVALVEPGTTVVGIRFRPGAAPSILGLPASELVDLRVELDRLWGPGAATLAELLGEAGAPGSAARLLEDEIARRLAAATAPDPFVTAAVGRLQPWSGGLGDWASGVYISPRQLRRRFVAAVGLSPKTFQRILRFQGFLALTQGRHQGHVGLARLAQRAGYADQAHLTREGAALTGLTPRAFLEQMWRSCGPNHDHEASYARLRRALLARPLVGSSNTTELAHGPAR